MTTRTLPGLLFVSLAALVLSAPPVATGAGEKIAVFGTDTTPTERQELIQLFNLDASSRGDLITSEEIATALQGTGLPAAPTEKSISSALLTCLNAGDGLTVRTQNITRIPAGVYANALVTAGVGDGSVLIAAPSTNPATGEAALAGVLKAVPQCQAGTEPDAGRVRLAYEQIARTVALAGPTGDLNRASATLLRAAQPVLLGQARDDTAIGAALDSAAGAEGVQVPPAQRADLVGFLRRLGGLDYGAYAGGYQVQQVSPSEVRVVSAGPGAPAAPAATPVSATPVAAAATPAGATPAAPAAATAATAGTAAALPVTGGTVTGTVDQPGPPLTIRAGGEFQRMQVAPDVAVTRDGKSASFTDIRRGDKVSVIILPDGMAHQIDATSAGGGAGWLKWLLPLLLGLVALGLIFLFLSRRRRDSFILEPNSVPAEDQDRVGSPR